MRWLPTFVVLALCSGCLDYEGLSRSSTIDGSTASARLFAIEPTLDLDVGFALTASAGNVAEVSSGLDGRPALRFVTRGQAMPTEYFADVAGDVPHLFDAPFWIRTTLYMPTAGLRVSFLEVNPQDAGGGFNLLFMEPNTQVGTFSAVLDSQGNPDYKIYGTTLSPGQWACLELYLAPVPYESSMQSSSMDLYVNGQQFAANRPIRLIGQKTSHVGIGIHHYVSMETLPLPEQVLYLAETVGSRDRVPCP